MISISQYRLSHTCERRMTHEMLLLGLLQAGKMHGYRLNEYVAHAMSICTNLKRSTAYYTLSKLESKGYVTSELEREGRRPERRVYEITERGWAYFLRLLRSQMRELARTYYADDVSIAFMDCLPAGDARGLLVGKRGLAEALLERFREVPEHGGNWRYVVMHNIMHLETEIAWLDFVLSELGDERLQPVAGVCDGSERGTD